MIADEWMPLPMNPEDTGWIALAYRDEEGVERILRRTKIGYEMTVGGKTYETLIDLKGTDLVRFETAPGTQAKLKVNAAEVPPREKPKGEALGDR